MAIRLDTMTAPHPTSSQVHLLRLIWRLLALLACAVAAGVASALLYLASPSLIPATFSLLSPAAIGLATGLAGRWLLRERSELMRITAVFAAVALSMTFLGWLSSGMAGVLLRNDRLATPDWSALALLALGWMSGWLALRAWRTVPAPVAQPAPPPPPERPDAVRRTRRGQSTQSHPKTRKVGLRVPPSLERHAHLPRLRRRGAQLISFKGRTEHRCPYCLEIVRRRDPRGVVICPECKTPHHADCWAITGMCQVPHQHK